MKAKLLAMSCLVLLLLTVAMLAGCSDDDGGGIPGFNAANFDGAIDNRFFPLVPGTTYLYEGENDEGEVETVEVRVTGQTRQILGVTTTVVRDMARVDGALVEDTLDFFAQDRSGNVWYFGEESKEYEDGQVISTEGSWLAGVNGARPGIIMLANPRVGQEYAQESAPGVAEDRARVVSLSEPVTVPFGSFANTLQTLEFTPLEPGISEHKFYAPGVGLVLVEQVQGGDEFLELVDIQTP